MCTPRRSATPVQLFQGARVAPQCFRSIVEPPLIYCGEGERYPHRILVQFTRVSSQRGEGWCRICGILSAEVLPGKKKKKSRSLVPLWWCAERHRRAAFISFIQHAALVSSCSTHARNTQHNATKPSHFVSLWRLNAAAAASHTAHLKLVLKTLFCCLHSVYMHVCV